MKKMFCPSLLSLMLAVLLAGFCIAGDEEAIRQSLTKSYPNLTVGKIRPSAVSCLYELEVGTEILYFFPEKELVVFREMWTREGKSLTAERRQELAARRFKDIPLDKGIKIGSGATVVIEFTDPDCPYCRKASAYLGKRKDTTRYVYFLPLPTHKDAEKHARYILSSSDKAKAYEEVMSGKHDGERLDTCNDAKVSALIDEHRELAVRAGVSATPSFLIHGHVVTGLNIPAIEELLEHQKNLN